MIQEISNFYQKILKFSPYEYQTEVAELLLSGKNVILSVPTGAGKTWASIIPFLIAKQRNSADFPQKMIYSLPLRTLTNSIHLDVTDTLKKHSEFSNLASKQTGEYSEDKYFEKDIVFSTIDQTLSNFLSFPLPLSKRQANINAGAIIGSYLVFDEFHLLDPQLSMASTLGTLRMLSNMTRFCIMTATMSNRFINFIQNDSGLNNIEIVTLKDFPNDRKKINSLIAPKNEVKKTISVSENTINAENIINSHKNKTIVICNRVETAQNLFIELEKIKNTETELFCIHSRFFDKDRKGKERLVKKYFKKGSKKNAILISTQVIEAGMDISCEVLHTEVSPVNSFLQRAGRCARYENETGKISVYDILTPDEKTKLSEELSGNETDKKEIRKLNNKYLPYDHDLCKKTFEILKETPSIDEKVAEDLVNKIMTAQEQKNTENIRYNMFNQEKIRVSWQDCKKSNYRNTIRDIQSVDLVIINDKIKDKVALQPYSYESIGLYKWTFIGKWKKLGNGNEDYPVFQLEENNIFDFGEEEYKLKPANYEKITDNRFYVNSNFFSYDSKIGLNFIKIGNGVSGKSSKNDKKDEFKPLKSDTFIEHNMALLNYYRKIFKPKMNFIFKELPKFMQAENIDFNKLIEIMIVMHDYGKLNIDWQVPIKKYQSIKSGKIITEALAHSDFDRTNDEDIELSKKTGMNKKPEHSVIGAFALKVMLHEQNFEEILIDPVCSAISKHHNADTIVKKINQYSITKNDYNSIEALLKKIKIESEPLPELNEKEMFFELFEEHKKIKQEIFEFILSRILRVCDQRATADIK
ncbi:MAG: CRISPR-associated helicase Cas3' [Bacteroidales bacterium]|nr:CRISPR-associated helicase Cas3' [Bacteroidales bacterium]